MPDLVVTLIAAPGDRPYSAEYGLVTTLNSWMESIEGRDTWLLSSWTLVEIELLSTPSRRKLFCSERFPCTFTPPVRPRAVAAALLAVAVALHAGDQASRSSQLRMASGSLAIAFWSSTVPTADCSVFSRRRWASTVTASERVPTPRVKSTRARWPVSRMTASARFWNPAASASTTYWPGMRFTTR